VALQLRAAREEDAATIAALHLASWRDAHRGILDDAFLDGPAETVMAEHWHAALAHRPMRYLVLLASIGAEATGFVAARRRGVTALVDNLHVRPGLRGAGIGRTLLGAVARRMRSRGCVGVELGVFAANIPAIRFYGALGARIGPEEAGETFGQSVPERRCTWPEIDQLIQAAAEPKPR
jgi:ribosomal protein S18 acetylase RimI-like enzyme